MSFEVFRRGTSPARKDPSVTIQKRGIISINKAALELIGGPESVELLFDRDSQVVGLRPSTAPHAYALRQQPAGRSSGQVMLSASAFTQYYGIDTSVSRRYKPYLQEGMLCIDLRGDSVEVHRGRTSREDPVES